MARKKFNQKLIDQAERALEEATTPYGVKSADEIQDALDRDSRRRRYRDYSYEQRRALHVFCGYLHYLASEKKFKPMTAAEQIKARAASLTQAIKDIRAAASVPPPLKQESKRAA